MRLMLTMRPRSGSRPLNKRGCCGQREFRSRSSKRLTPVANAGKILKSRTGLQSFASTARPTSTSCAGREFQTGNNNPQTGASQPNNQVQDLPMSGWRHDFHTASDSKPSAASVGRLHPSTEYRVARRFAAQPPMDQTPIRNISRR